MSDADGDSHMASSSDSSEKDLDAMFPESNDSFNMTSTPHNANIQNLQQFSELSPPASEGHADSQSFGQDPMDQANDAEGSMPLESFSGGAAMDTSQQQLSIANREPGASWNTRKCQDEEARARENLLDKGFSLKEFGDIYNAKDMSDEV